MMLTIFPVNVMMVQMIQKDAKEKYFIVKKIEIAAPIIVKRLSTCLEYKYWTTKVFAKEYELCMNYYLANELM